jgi:anti-anti-sigma factor
MSAEAFKVERHGDVAVIIPPPEVESMHEALIQQAAQIVLSPLKADPPGGIVIDLSNVAYFGSTFISFLLRCYMLAKRHDSVVVLAGASERIRELLHLMALDMLWVYEPTKAAAIKTLSAD